MIDEGVADVGAGADDDAEHGRRQPASSKISASSRPPVTGVSDDGLITTALPSASAGATERFDKDIGNFHGLMTPTTPTGWRGPVLLAVIADGSTRPSL